MIQKSHVYITPAHRSFMKVKKVGASCSAVWGESNAEQDGIAANHEY